MARSTAAPAAYTDATRSTRRVRCSTPTSATVSGPPGRAQGLWCAPSGSVVGQPDEPVSERALLRQVESRAVDARERGLSMAEEHRVDDERVGVDDTPLRE